VVVVVAVAVAVAVAVVAAVAAAVTKVTATAASASKATSTAATARWSAVAAASWLRLFFFKAYVASYVGPVQTGLLRDTNPDSCGKSATGTEKKQESGGFLFFALNASF
jgi:hypothetical protein